MIGFFPSLKWSLRSQSNTWYHSPARYILYWDWRARSLTCINLCVFCHHSLHRDSFIRHKTPVQVLFSRSQQDCFESACLRIFSSPINRSHWVPKWSLLEDNNWRVLLGLFTQVCHYQSTLESQFLTARVIERWSVSLIHSLFWWREILIKEFQNDTLN